MKRAAVSLCFGVIGFCLTYVALCYLVPGWRIKLDAEPMAYFMASIRSLVVVKSMISAGAGLIFAWIPWRKKG